MFAYFAKMKLQKWALIIREIQLKICSKFESPDSVDVTSSSIKNESILQTIENATCLKCWTIKRSDIGSRNALKNICFS